MKKILIGSALVLSLVIGVGAQNAQALTSAEAEAIIAALSLDATKAAAIRALVTPTSTTGSGATVTFTRNLTIGSSGTDVAALQTFLESNGFLVMPAGVAKGYFGSITKSALVRYQASVGLPSTGYFGPLTINKINSVGTPSTPTTPTIPGVIVCPVGFVCTPTTGTPTTPGTGTITTPGAEGSITVSLSSTPSSGTTVREGQTKQPIIGAKVEAVNSDIRIQRIRVNLGTSATAYTKIFNTLYATDESGNVIGTLPLNSSTVTEDGSNWIATITGINYVIPRGASRNIIIAADLYSTIDSGQEGSKTVTIPVNGIRGQDGAGIDQYGPSAEISRSVTVAGSTIDDATISQALGIDTPKATEVVANENRDGGATENDLDKLTLATIKLEAKQDDVEVTRYTLGISNLGTGSATATTAYLYDSAGSLLSSAAIVNGVADFTDDFWVRLNDNGGIKNLVVKADIRNANTTSTSFQVVATSTSLVAENSEATDVTDSGTVTGNSIVVRNIGPVFTLTSKPITKSQTSSQNNTSTSTAQAVFNLHIKAVGGDIVFGTTASGTPAFGTSTTYFKVYQNGSATTLLVASTTSFTTPSSGVTTSGIGANSFKLPEGNEIDLPVTFLFEGRTTAGVAVSTGNYSVGLEGIKWTADDGANITTSNFMAGNVDWRTSEVVLP